MKRNIARFILSASLVLPLAACGGRSDNSDQSADCDPGITNTTVKLGSSLAYSGAAAALKAAPDAVHAYFDEINKKGGVKMKDGHRRKVEYVTLDDAFDPARTVSNTRTLVEKEGVFALTGMAGTSGVLAVLDYTTSKKVPVLFPSTGSNEILAKLKERPLVSGVMLPQVDWEIEQIVAMAVDAKPGAKIAVLYPNDGLGKGVLAAAEKSLKGTHATIVAKESYEQTSPSIDSQMVKLEGSGADVFFNFGTGSFVTQGLKKARELGWAPDIFVISSSTDVGSILRPAGPGAADKVRSVKWIYDVSDHSNDDQPGMKRWRAFADRNSGKVSSENSIAAQAYNNAQVLTVALETMKGCTRADLLEATQNLKGVTTDLTLPGVSYTVTPDYPYAVSKMSTMHFDGQKWIFDKIVSRDTK